jgi:hypothetical protein
MTVEMTPQSICRDTHIASPFSRREIDLSPKLVDRGQCI